MFVSCRSVVYKSYSDSFRVCSFPFLPPFPCNVGSPFPIPIPVIVLVSPSPRSTGNGTVYGVLDPTLQEPIFGRVMDVMSRPTPHLPPILARRTVVALAQTGLDGS